MTVTRGRPVVATAAGALACSILSGCGLLDGSSRIEEALEYLPADATDVHFVDRAAIAERLEVDYLETGADRADLDRWARATADEPVATELDRSVAAMQGAAFSAFDLEWEAIAAGEELFVKVWKLADDTDFDAIADDLVDAGYEQQGSDEAPRFTGELEEIEEPYAQVLLTEVLLVPDERLVITGSSVLAGRDAVLDDADSLADSGSFGDLLEVADDPDDLEYAALSVSPSCETAALVAGAEDPVRVALVFDDEAAAEADVESREQRLSELAERNGVQADFEVRADGDTVLVETGFDERRVVTQMVQRNESALSCA